MCAVSRDVAAEEQLVGYVVPRNEAHSRRAPPLTPVWPTPRVDGAVADRIETITEQLRLPSDKPDRASLPLQREGAGGVSQTSTDQHKERPLDPHGARALEGLIEP